MLIAHVCKVDNGGEMYNIESVIEERMDILRSHGGREPYRLYLGDIEFRALADAVMGTSQSFSCQIRPFTYRGMRILRVSEKSWIDVS